MLSHRLSASTCLHKSVLVRTSAPYGAQVLHTGHKCPMRGTSAPYGVQVPHTGYKSRDPRSVFSSKKERTMLVCTSINTKLAKYRVFVQASTSRKKRTWVDHRC